MQSVQAARDQSLREQNAIEERMEFAILPSAMKSTVMRAESSRPSQEEQEMWNNHAFSTDIFNAGIDHTKAAVEERKRLEREATNFDLWHGADFLPENDPNDSELLLDKLEQEDILTELLKNTRSYITFLSIAFNR